MNSNSTTNNNTTKINGKSKVTIYTPDEEYLHNQSKSYLQKDQDVQSNSNSNRSNDVNNLNNKNRNRKSLKNITLVNNISNNHSYMADSDQDNDSSKIENYQNNRKI